MPEKMNPIHPLTVDVFKVHEFQGKKTPQLEINIVVIELPIFGWDQLTQRYGKFEGIPF